MRKILLLLVSILLLGSLFSCKESQKDVTLQLFHYKQEIVNQMNEIAAIFNQKYPNITVETETIPNDAQTVLRTRLIAGEAPDIMMLQGYSTVFEYAEAGYLLDLTNEPFMTRVVDGAKNSVTYNSKLYSLPMDMAGIGVIYNKDVFAEYGLEIPATFTELQTVCQTLKSNGVTPFSVSIKDNWPLGHFYSMAHTALVGDKLMSWIGDMNNGTGSFKAPADMNQAFKVFDFYKSNGGDKPMEMDYNNQTSNFASGEYGMMIQGLWAYGTAKQINPALNAGIFGFPFNDDASMSKLYVDTDSTLAISATSKNIAAAKKFLDFLTSEEGVKLWVEKCKLIPTVKGASVETMDAPFQDLVRYNNENKTMPWAFSMWPTVTFEESKKALQEYYSGQKTKDQVMEYLDEKWRAEKSK